MTVVRLPQVATPQFVIFEVLRKTSYATDDGQSWRHRQIVFTNKGDLPLGEEFEEIVRSRLLRIRQVARPFTKCSPTSGGSRLPFNALLFKGNGITSEGVRGGWIL